VDDRSFFNLVMDDGGARVVGVGQWRHGSPPRRCWWRDESLRLHTRCILFLNPFLCKGGVKALHTTKVSTFII